MKVFKVFLGTFLTAIGIVFFIKANAGVDPLSTFLFGVLNYVNIEFGTSSMIFNLTLLLILFFVDKSKIGFGSIVNSFFVGFFINILNYFKFSNLLVDNMYLNVILGPVIVGIGIGIYLHGGLGSGALESLMLIISERTKISIKYVRISIDATVVVTGILLGAIYGIGTFMGIVLIGPVIEFTMRGLRKYNL